MATAPGVLPRVRTPSVAFRGPSYPHLMGHRDCDISPDGLSPQMDLLVT